VNWDDLKYFLAVCRSGSIRSAAITLGVNHATVSRRINSFEKSLGERLFERTPKGYLRTKAADDIFEETLHLEERLSSVERKAAGKDKSLNGDIRITFVDLLAEHLLMPIFAEFCQLYPRVQLEIIDSSRAFNLANREADVAFRFCKEPPDYLIGRKLGNVHRACYVSKNLLENTGLENGTGQLNWLGWTDKMRRPIGPLARQHFEFGSKHKILSSKLQMEACKNGLGVALLPCFIGDSEETLTRIPPYTSEHKYDIWILSHPDLRQNKKVQTFVRFVTDKMLQQRPLIEGENFELPTY
jgi:DNA-binding transcriptional LysR family regulator